MKYNQCQCGELKFWGSGMNPSPCSKCDKCGTGIGPEYLVPKEHDFSMVEKVDTDEGPKTLSRCRWCYYSKADLEKKEKAR